MLVEKDINRIFLENFNEEVISYSPMGGMTNNNYLVKTNNNKYVLKLFGKGTEKLIDRVLEQQNLDIVQTLDLDVNNYYFDIKDGVKINEYIENAETLSNSTIKDYKKEIATILKKVHSSEVNFKSNFDIFNEINKYKSLIVGKIPYSYFEQIEEKILNLKIELENLGTDRKNCHIDLVAENFIKNKDRIYLIDWEYAALNDPMWDLAALFLESDFTLREELEFLSYYREKNTPINIQKINIYKILQDFLWSLWAIYKEENGSNFGSYGTDRYNRMIKNLRYYNENYGK